MEGQIAIARFRLILALQVLCLEAMWLPRGQMLCLEGDCRSCIANCSEHSSRGRLRLQSHCIHEHLPRILSALALTLLVCRNNDINLRGCLELLGLLGLPTCSRSQQRSKQGGLVPTKALHTAVKFVVPRLDLW